MLQLSAVIALQSAFAVHDRSNTVDLIAPHPSYTDNNDLFVPTFCSSNACIAGTLHRALEAVLFADVTVEGETG